MWIVHLSPASFIAVVIIVVEVISVIVTISIIKVGAIIVKIIPFAISVIRGIIAAVVLIFSRDWSWRSLRFTLLSATLLGWCRSWSLLLGSWSWIRSGRLPSWSCRLLGLGCRLLACPSLISLSSFLTTSSLLSSGRILFLSWSSGVTTEIRWKLELHVNVSTMEIVRSAQFEANILIDIKVDVVLRRGGAVVVEGAEGAAIEGVSVPRWSVSNRVVPVNTARSLRWVSIVMWHLVSMEVVVSVLMHWVMLAMGLLCLSF